MVVAVLAITLTLVLVVGIHEAGHAFAARLFAVKIKRISIGFGKPLLLWTSHSGCEWVWGLWPLGGYVQLLNTRISPVKPSELIHCFDKKPIWQRLIILSAGAIANIVTAWVALVLVFLMGIQYQLPQIQTVTANSLAAHAEISAGDQFVAINDNLTPSWREVGMQLVMLWGKPEVKVRMQKANSQAIKEFNLNLSQIHFSGKEKSLLNAIGLSPNLVAPQSVLKAPSLGAAMHNANATIGQLLYFFLKVLQQLLSGIIPFSVLLGPVGLFAASVASLSQGLVIFLYFIATLSLAVGLINVFPVPGLDGGSMVYALIEKMRGKPVSVAMEILVYQTVVIVFALLLVQLLINDLQRFYS